MAAGDPFGWVHAAQDVQNVTFRATNGGVYELWRLGASIGFTNLSGFAGAPNASGDPRPYEHPAIGAHNVVYRGTTGRGYVLWWFDGPVSRDDLTAASGVPAPAGNVIPYISSHSAPRTSSSEV